MADLNAHIRGLVELGLSRYEAKAYLTLIQRESYVASELAVATGIPRPRIYDVLNSLISRGVVLDLPGPVTRYVGRDPLAAVDRLLAVQRQALSGLEAQSAALATGMRDGSLIGRGDTAPLGCVEVLRDSVLLGAQFVELLRSAQSQLLTFSRPPYALPNNQVGLAATQRITHAGGDVRCIYETRALDDPAVVAEALQFIQAGEDARVAEEVPMKLCLADGHRALLSLADPTADGIASTNILIEHRALTLSLYWAFETLWKLSTPFERAFPPPTRSSAQSSFPAGQASSC
jgi:hypothetical protein